ncbi:MAG: pitrilysin family protein [Bacteroidales bacterium]|jgi:predicted Zn-dependent peptidase|nr:pitrilysin family protein [Bacteroidales bacterium]NLM92719.1 insulinase family protein [Bacteroidales bacterium]
MVDFDKYVLSNGLRVIVHRDSSTPLAAVNVLYDVGARDEDPQRTGFAHLFEHLMFEGSVHIPDFDTKLQDAGGENNAFTSNDLTNYYDTLPAQNLETAFWLESDRMLELAFSEEKLAVQKNVVIEEFRQSYLNQPYGDVWMLLRPLAYQQHPYMWPTIGKDISHIRDASLEEVKHFFRKFYHPGNAILTVTGNVKADEVFRLTEKWFGDIPGGEPYVRSLPQEPVQTSARRLAVERDVPFDQIFMAFPCYGRGEDEFYAADLLSDILSNGSSSRLVQRLVKGRRMFSEVNAYLTGNLDRGLFIVTGKLHEDTGMKDAEQAFQEELEALRKEKIGERELQKVKNKAEASHVYSEANVLTKAVNLAYYELMGDAGLLNRQPELYSREEADHLQETANEMFKPECLSVLEYHSSKTSP